MRKQARGWKRRQHHLDVRLCPINQSSVLLRRLCFDREPYEKRRLIFGHYGLGRVNNVGVGFLIGAQNRRLLLAEDGTPTPRGLEVLNATSQHRFLSPADVARPVLYLADNEVSAGVNGHTLRVDGGFGIVNLAGSGYAFPASGEPAAR